MIRSIRVSSIFLAVCLALSALPLTLYAADISGSDDSVIGVATPSTTAAPIATILSATDHDLSTGPITLTAADGDIRVYGSYIGDGNGITVEGDYNGIITLDNVSIDVLGIGIYIEPKSQTTINLIGRNIIKGISAIYFDVRPLPITAEVILTGSGILEAYGTPASSRTRGAYAIGVIDIVGGNLNIDVETIAIADSMDDSYFGIRCDNLTITAPVQAEGRTGILAGGAVILADTITMGNGGAGFVSQTNIVVDNCTLISSGNGGYYYDDTWYSSQDLPYGIVWGYNYKNTTIGAGNVVAHGGMTENGIQVYDYATYDLTSGTYQPRNNFLDSYNASSTVLASDPTTTPTIPTAVIPMGSLPSGVNLDDLEFHSNPLNSSAKNSLAQEILSSGVSGIGSFTSNPNWMNNAEWLDLTLIDTANGNAEVQPSGAITVYLPFPSGRNSANSDFILLHKTSTGIEVVPFIVTSTGIKFTVDSLSPFALLWTSKPPVSTTISSKSSKKSGGSSTSTRNVSIEQSFWNNVVKYIRVAMRGEVVDILLPYYVEQIPAEVLATIAGKDKTLILQDSNNGKTVYIYGGDLKKSMVTKKAYTLSEISDLLGMKAPSGSSVSSVEDLHNPITGGDGDYIPIASQTFESTSDDTSAFNGDNPLTGGGEITLYSSTRTTPPVSINDTGQGITIPEEDKIAYIIMLSFMGLAIILPLLSEVFQTKRY